MKFVFATGVILDIDIGRDDAVYEVFMDITGDHVIVSMMSETNYYLHRGSKSLRQLSKFNVSKLYNGCKGLLSCALLHFFCGVCLKYSVCLRTARKIWLFF